MNLYFIIGYSGYFVLGYYLNSYKLNRKNEIIAYILGVCGAVATFLLTQYISSVKGEPIQTYYGYLKPNVMLVAIAVFVFFSQRISRIKFSERHKTIITTVSTYSFGMYLIHVFFNILFGKIKLTTMLFNAIFSVPMITIAVFLASLWVIHLLRKIPLIKKYMT